MVDFWVDIYLSWGSAMGKGNSPFSRFASSPQLIIRSSGSPARKFLQPSVPLPRRAPFAHLPRWFSLFIKVLLLLLFLNPTDVNCPYPLPIQPANLHLLIHLVGWENVMAICASQRSLTKEDWGRRGKYKEFVGQSTNEQRKFKNEINDDYVSNLLG